jgi:sugar/nucleoside kinase (ribokinase family)
MTQPVVFGIGNPLIDVVMQAADSDLTALTLDKGIMHLVTEERQRHILEYFGDAPRAYRPGGSAPNTVVALAGLGVPALISGKIGQDEFGRTYDQQVSAYGVGSRLVQGTGATGSSVILVTPDGERTMNTYLGMCQEFSAADLDEESLKNARFLYFTGYMWDTEVQKAAIRRAVARAKEHGVTVVFDVADPFAVNRYRDDFLELIARDVDIVFANEWETSILYGEKSRAELITLLGEHVHVAVMKVGKDGSVVSENGRQSEVPGRPITATDSTGAGDMFAAGFLAAYAAHNSAVRAAQAAGYLAEEVIQQIGAQFTVDQIETIQQKMTTEGLL